MAISIYTSMQKGGIQDFSECVEYTSVISQRIHEAKVWKKYLTVDPPTPRIFRILKNS